MYREQPATLFDFLAARLEPMGFVAMERRWLHRKTWNTNRGVVLARLKANTLVSEVARLRDEAKRILKHSSWNQLGLQIVFEVESGSLPPRELLSSLVDSVNQGALIQSIFVIDPATNEILEARTWGQLITGKFQDGIAAALADFVSARA